MLGTLDIKGFLSMEISGKIEEEGETNSFLQNPHFASICHQIGNDYSYVVDVYTQSLNVRSDTKRTFCKNQISKSID